jgi:hypothetical protein
VRRRVGTRGILAALAAAAVVGTAAVALAVCGDANGDGNVTVSDGVQTLRAAAGLSSACGQDCDVDGSGSVTVSDGVNVLRKAAGLAVVEACPDGDPVSSLIGHTIDVFGPLTKIGAVGGASAAGGTSPCDNPGGGFQQTASGFTFDDCRIGNVTFTGFLGTNDGQLSFDDLVVARRGDQVSFAGLLSVGESGGDPQLNGVLNGDSRQLGTYVVFYQGVVTGAQGQTLGGELVFDTSEADLGDVVEVRVTLTGGTSLPVLVTHADDSTENFFYDVNTDTLTPANGPTPTPTPPLARVRLFNIDDTITAFLNGTQVLQASSTGPNATQDTTLQPVAGLVCGDNVFEFRVTNNPGGGGYTFGVQLEVGGTLEVNRSCGTVGVQGCDGNAQTTGEVARDVTFVCVPCAPCTRGAGTCAAPIQIPASGRIQIHGKVSGANHVNSPCGGGGGPESVFTWTPAAQTCVTFSSCGTTFDSQLSVGDGFCGGPNGPLDESCFDDNQSCVGGGAHESTFGNFSAGEPVTFVLDSEGSQGGSYTFDIRPSGDCIF